MARAVEAVPEQDRGSAAPCLCESYARVTERSALASARWLGRADQGGAEEAACAGMLEALERLGVRLSLDDFGTGYSSLVLLQRLPVSEIKVDRSFITAIHERPRSQSVLRAIESLGQALGMSMVAEGVETFEELAYLQAATRIRCAQGYYFAKPFFLYDGAAAKRINFSDRNTEAARENSERRSARASRGA